jgi:tetrapyrrole methylase family protein / MazG family protein
MVKNFKLVYFGLGAEAVEAIRRLNTVDLAIARGSTAMNLLTMEHIPNARLFSKKANQTLDQWKQETLAELKEGATILYLTPIVPMMADQVGCCLSQGLPPANIKIHRGEDMAFGLSSLLSSCTHSPLVTADSLLLEHKHHPPFSPDNSILIYAIETQEQLLEVQWLLSKIFPQDHHLHPLIQNAEGEISWSECTLSKLADISNPITILFVPPASHDSSLESFQELIAHLRAPEDGCPWDKKQTHASLRTYLLEETYEALDALDKNDLESLKEELGDILLQILLHSQIAAEDGEFTMADVLSGINRKIVYRHPHVFKDWVVNGETEVIQNWESLKGQERLKNGDESKKGMLDGVPISYPALAQAQAIQDRAARVGFDWPEIGPVLDKVMEELEEVKTAPNEIERAKELGDLLFALVNVIRWYKVDSESALRQTNLKFRKRFAYIEEQARLSGKEMQKMSLVEMDAFWEQAKQFDV